MDALAKVPRHEFVPLEMRPYAYADSPLPIGADKTISQPFIVAAMTDLLDLQPGDKVLEIGTGLGYQTAILAELARRVYSVERIEELADAGAPAAGAAGTTPTSRSGSAMAAPGGPSRRRSTRSSSPPRPS